MKIDQGRCVAPRYYTKEGYDRGVVTKVVNRRQVWVKWSKHPTEILENVSDLDGLSDLSGQPAYETV